MMVSDELKTPLAEAVRQIAAMRRAAQPPLVPEDLLALARGELEKGSKAEVEERLSLDPEAVQALLDLRRFPAVEPREDGRRIEDFELEARWRSLRERWEQERRPGRGRGAGLRALPWAVAALFVLSLGLGGWVLTLRQQVEHLRGPRANTEVLSLLPEDDTLRAVGSGEVAASDGRLLLILNQVDRGVHRAFRLEVSSAEVPLFTLDGLERHPTRGNFTVELPWDRLPPGELRLVLSGRGAGGWEPVASYHLWIGAEPPP